MDYQGKLLAVPDTWQKRVAVPLYEPIPPEAAVALINQRYALQPLTVAEVELRRMALANDQVDRTWERFSPAMLQRLGETLVGKSVLAHHQKWDYPLGRFYGTTVERGSDGWTWLMAEYYMLKANEHEVLRAEIDAGVVSYVSIGFRGGKEWCDLCGGWWLPWSRECAHWPGETYRIDGVDRICTLTWEDPDGNAEAVEGSFVWLGAQYEAAVVKHLARERGGTREMERIKELEIEVERLKGALATQETAAAANAARAETLAGERKQLEQRVGDLEAEAAGLRTLAADGERYRADLLAEIQRLGGLIGAEKEATTVGAALAAVGVAALKEARGEYQARVDKQFPPAPVGQPASESEANRPAAGAGTGYGFGLV